MSESNKKIPSKAELIRDYLSEQDSPRRDANDPQDSHSLVYEVACKLLQGFDLAVSELESWLVEFCQRSDQPWSISEIQHKIRAAQAAPSKYPAGWLYRKLCRDKGFQPAGTTPKRVHDGVAREPQIQPKWKLPFCRATLERYAKKDLVVDVKWFEERSPLKPSEVDAARFLNSVFRPGEKTIVFTRYSTQGQFGHVAGQSHSWRLAARPGVNPVPSALPSGGPDGVWFLANPVDGQWHPNPRDNGKMSRRSQESISAYRNIVFETDEPGIDELWLNFLAQLPLPILAIYSSGGKSWHALCRLDFPTKQHLDAFKQRHGGMFSKLGADPRAWSPTQLTRLPGCMRNGRLQRLIYLNPSPDPLGIPIVEGGYERV